MKIIKSNNFKLELQNILNFIGQDSINRAELFYKNIMSVLEKLNFMPYSHRQSIYFNNENIRDLIFKGYVIPYKITQKEIIILDIIKYRHK